MARSRIAVAGAEDKVEDALSSIGGVEVAIVVGDVVMLIEGRRLENAWRRILKQQQNFTAYSPKYEQAQLYHHASDPQRVKCSKMP